VTLLMECLSNRFGNFDEGMRFHIAQCCKQYQTKIQIGCRVLIAQQFSGL